MPTPRRPAGGRVRLAISVETRQDAACNRAQGRKSRRRARAWRARAIIRPELANAARPHGSLERFRRSLPCHHQPGTTRRAHSSVRERSIAGPGEPDHAAPDPSASIRELETGPPRLRSDPWLPARPKTSSQPGASRQGQVRCAPQCLPGQPMSVQDAGTCARQDGRVNGRRAG